MCRGRWIIETPRTAAPSVITRKNYDNKRINCDKNALIISQIIMSKCIAVGNKRTDILFAKRGGSIPRCLFL